MIDLPPATPKPCNDCPWRRNAAPGWLGPHTPQEWIEIAHGEQPIACHQTIAVEDWTEPDLRQCKGAAIFRANIAKSPRNPQDARHGTEPDTESVFSWDNEFIEYHSEIYEKRYARYREE